MKLSWKDIAGLIVRHRMRRLNEPQKAQLRQWITLHSDNQSLFSNLSNDEYVTEKLEQMKQVNLNDEWTEIRRKLPNWKIGHSGYLFFAVMFFLIVVLLTYSYLNNALSNLNFDY